MAEEESSQPEITMSVRPRLDENVMVHLADDANSTVKGPSEHKLSITISPKKTVTDLKDVIASKSDVEKDRQRLIYSGVSLHVSLPDGSSPDGDSGKVLKDEELISQYKIQVRYLAVACKGSDSRRKVERAYDPHGEGRGQVGDSTHRNGVFHSWDRDPEVTTDGDGSERRG